MEQYRQGDVLVERIDNLPDEVKTEVEPTNETEKLLIRGESRNHGHYIKGKVTTYTVPNPDVNTQNITHFLEVDNDAFLEHININAKTWSKEHETLRLIPGIYRVIRQREYNPYQRAINIIKD